MNEAAAAPPDLSAGARTPVASTAVVIVNYGSHRLVERATADLGEAQVVVVDNFTTLDEQVAIRTLAAARGWSIVLRPDNRGFGSGCNAGAARAWELGCDRLILLNPDAILSSTVVAELAEMVGDDRRVVSPRITDSAGSEVFAGARLDMSDGRIRSKRPDDEVRSDAEDLAARGTWVPWLTGACFAMHRSLWDELGGFRESFFLYWEDVDITVRAFRTGATLTVRHDLTAVHDEGGTHADTTERAKSATYYDWNCRNRLRFAGGTLSRREIARWLVSTPAVSWEILMRGGRRQLLSRPGLLWAALRGTLVGVVLAVRGLIRPAESVRGDAVPVG